MRRQRTPAAPRRRRGRAEGALSSAPRLGPCRGRVPRVSPSTCVSPSACVSPSRCPSPAPTAVFGTGSDPVFLNSLARHKHPPAARPGPLVLLRAVSRPPALPPGRHARRPRPATCLGAVSSPRAAPPAHRELSDPTAASPRLRRHHRVVPDGTLRARGRSRPRAAPRASLGPPGTTCCSSSGRGRENGLLWGTPPHKLIPPFAEDRIPRRQHASGTAGGGDAGSSYSHFLIKCFQPPFH